MKTTHGTKTKRTKFPSDDPRALMAQQAGSALKLEEVVKDPYARGVLLQQRKRRAEKLRSTFKPVVASERGSQ